jgi:hypothetical protein
VDKPIKELVSGYHFFNRPDDIREYLTQVFQGDWSIKPDKLVEIINWFYFLDDYLGSEGVELRRCSGCEEITINPRHCKNGCFCDACIDNGEGIAT